MLGFKDRHIVSSAVIVAALASVALVVVKHRRADEKEAPSEAPATRPRPLVSPLVPEQSRALAVTDDTADAALLAPVEHIDELRRRLLERESEINLRSRDGSDAGIGKILPAESFAYYHSPEDSDLEQRHLAEYTGGISNVASLNEQQKRIVLDAKLKQKQRYASVMRDAGLEREGLSKQQHASTHARAVQALQQYLEAFLADVAPSLTQEQYAQLKNYETIEFARELSRLQRINAN